MSERDSASDAGAGLYKFLRLRSDDIVTRWTQSARELLPARDLSARALTNHIPDILERIAGIIEAGLDGQSASTGLGPDIHAIDRLGRGYNLEEVIKEYTLLRRCILNLWQDEAGGAIVRVAEITGLEDAIEQCIAESAERFARERERTLRVLDEISEAGFGSTDQQSFFKRLLQAVIDAMEVVDLAAILLRDGDVLSLRAIAGIETEKEVQAEFSLQIGEGLAGKIAAEQRPLFVSNAAEDVLIQSALLRKVKLRAFYGVPLTANGDVIGVTLMGSRTASEFSDDDRLLFETMASRASLVIQSALLQEQLRESSARNEAILKATLECVVSMDDDGRIVDWNKAAERTFGYSRAEAIGADLADMIIPPRYRAAYRAGLSRYLATGEQRYFDRRLELEGLRRNGEEFPAEITITRVAGQKPLFTGFLRDITDEQQARHERERLIRELSRAEDAQRFLSDSSKKLAESLDYDATLATIAQLAVPRIADWCAVDMIQQRQLRRVSVAHRDPQKTKFVQQMVRRYPPGLDPPHGVPQVVRTGRSHFVNDISDSRLAEIARDEEHLRLLRSLGLKSYISAPVNIRGSVRGAITVVSGESGRQYREADVLLVEKLALRVATAIENARLYSETQAAVHTREDVLAVVSHDLRNPLGTITMSANALKLMLASANTEAQQAQQIDIILRAAQRMEHLIRDLLDMASIQANRLSVELRPTKLFPLLNEALETHQAAAAAAGIVLRQKLNVESVEVLCDHNRLIQALSNLLGNAIKFCTTGDIITLAAERLNGEAVISVADTGPGIQATEFEKIFNPYWTTARKGTPGTGLGLYTTKTIVEAHGGRIWVESEPGAGATFFFTLPIDVPVAG